MFTLAIDNQISVRSIHPDDTAELYNLLERNRSHLHPWIHSSMLPETVQATRIYAIECFYYSLEDPLDVLSFPYFDELNGYFPPASPPLEMGIRFCGELVGVIALSRLADSFTAAEFGYWLALEWEGNGIITRCVRALMDYAIDIMKIDRFVIRCAAENRRSRAVAERLGYRLHSTIPNGEVIGDFVYDQVIYGIRSKTWLERKTANVENGSIPG